MLKNAQFQQHSAVFSYEAAMKKDIEEAGHAGLLAVYNTSNEDDIDFLHCERFCKKVATNSIFVHSQVLLPTASTTKYTIVSESTSKCKFGCTRLSPVKLEWALSHERLVPKEMDP